MKKIRNIIIIIVVLIIILLFVQFSSKSPAQIELDQKQAAVDNLYNIWVTINQGKPVSNARIDFVNNAPQIKAELNKALTLPEINFLTEYSTNAKTFLEQKSMINQQSLALITYLSANYKNMKTVMAKTSIGDLLTVFGINIPNFNF